MMRREISSLMRSFRVWRDSRAISAEDLVRKGVSPDALAEAVLGVREGVPFTMGDKVRDIAADALMVGMHLGIVVGRMPFNPNNPDQLVLFIFGPRPEDEEVSTS